MSVLLLMCSIAFFIGFLAIVRNAYMDNSKKKIEDEFRRAIHEASSKKYKTVILPNLDTLHEQQLEHNRKIMANQNKIRAFDHLAPIPKQPLSMKEAIEKALPSTPVGCMWAVKKVKDEWWEGMVSVPVAYKAKLQFVSSDQAEGFNSEIGFKNEYMTLRPDSSLWAGVPESGKKYKLMLEIQLITPNKTITTQIQVNDSQSTDVMIERLTTSIMAECGRMIEQYRRDEEEWDGVYIKNEE